MCPFTAALSASPKSVKVDKVITIKLKVKNIGPQAATVTPPQGLSRDGHGLVSKVSGPQPQSATIRPMGSNTFTCKY